MAFEVAASDPTEEDHLGVPAAAAASRLKTAFAELLGASLALAAILLGHLVLACAANSLQRERKQSARGLSPCSGVERSILSLGALLDGWIWRRALGQVLALRMLGGRCRTEAGGERAVSLKIASGRYRIGQTPSGFGYAAASDSASVRVLIGVSARANEAPIYRIRRFVEIEPGRFEEILGYRSLDPAEAFAMDLDPR